MDIEKLKYLLTQDEGPKLDFKLDLDMDLHSTRNELAKDVIALANAQGGRGYLIYGIEDKTKIVKGVDKEKFGEERIQQIISLIADPPINIRVENFTIDYKDIVTITVFKSHKKPHQSRQSGAFYIRRGSTTDTARIDEIASLFQKSNLIGNEKLPLYNLEISVLNFDIISEYLEKINIRNQSHNLELLSNFGIISYDMESKAYSPTIGGLLFFCDLPQNYLSYVGIKLINRINGANEIINLKGNLINLFRNSIMLIKERVDFLVIDGIVEALGNAIIHRDYFDNTREIVIYLSDEKIIISNPGSSIENIKFKDIIKEKNHKRRNFWLYKTFLTIDDDNYLLENFNGLEFIKEFYEGDANVEFLSSRNNNLFKVLIEIIK